MSDFVNIYNSYNLQVRSILFRYSGSEEQLDEMVQETFIKIWKNFSKFSGNSSLKTWIYRVAVNSAIDYLRKHKRHSNSVSYDESLSSTKSNEQVIINQQLITTSLQSLSSTQRQVIILAIYQELKLTEIAQVLEIPIGTVKSRLHNAKLELLKSFKSHGINHIDFFASTQGGNNE